MTIALNKPLPKFTAKATGGLVVKPSAFKGKKLVLYFYSKDNTSGCTNEATAFRDLYTEFQEAGAEIVGVSRDSMQSHEKFGAKYDLPFPLVSDPEEELCRLFEVIKMKKMYGREFMGVERSTFLADASGVLRREWRKVKVQGHAREVLEAVKSLLP